MFLEGLVENLKYCHAFVYDIAVQTSTSETEKFFISWKYHYENARVWTFAKSRSGARASCQLIKLLNV